MNWTLRADDGRRLVTPAAANLDASVAAEFRERMLGLLEDPAPLTLDLRRVEFADSSGLGVLCALAARARPGQFAVQGATARLEKVLSRLPAGALPVRRTPAFRVLSA